MPKRLSRRSKRTSSLHLPFDRELPQFLLGSINERKIKEAKPASAGIFRAMPGEYPHQAQLAKRSPSLPDTEERAHACLPRRRRAVYVRDAMLDAPLTRPPGCPA